MKKVNTPFKPILIIAFLFTHAIVQTQTYFNSGYIIQTTGDTLYGKIIYKGNKLANKLCAFVNKDGEETGYTPNEIYAYRINDGKFYISKELNGKKIFLEYLFKGSLKLFYFKDSLGNHYLVEKENVGISEFIYTEKFTRTDGGPNMYKSIKQVGSVNIFKETPEYQTKIARMGSLDHLKMINLVREYGKKVSKNKKYTVFEKEIIAKNIIIEPQFGLVNFNVVDFKDLNYLQKGLIFHFGMANVNKKLYFKTGLLHTELQINKTTQALYKIPVQFEFIYSNRIINPKFAFGLNFYKPYYDATAFMFGFNIKYSKSVYWAFNYEIDFNPNYYFILIPHSLLSQSVTLGLQVKL